MWTGETSIEIFHARTEYVVINNFKLISSLFVFFLDVSGCDILITHMIWIDILDQECDWVSFSLRDSIILSRLSNCIARSLYTALRKPLFKEFWDYRLIVNEIRLGDFEFIIGYHFILFLHIHDKWVILSQDAWKFVLCHVLSLH